VEFFRETTVYSNIQSKCSAYKELIEEMNIPYVVAVYCDFFADVRDDVIKECLYAKETGLFENYPGVSGVLFINDNFAIYQVTYMPNRNATRPFNLPDGIMDLSLWLRGSNPTPEEHG
jgi:hypothetical protein